MSEINNIKSNAPGGVNNPRSNAVDSKSSTTKTGADNASTADTFKLTDDASQLQALQQMITSMPEVNQQRIAELREAIEKGEYQVDSQKLAQNMIDFEGQF